MPGAPRVVILLAMAVTVVGIGYAIKGFSQPATKTVASSYTLSPYEIHLNYKRMKELPVHASTNAF
jgi:hypothetical protein